MSKGKGVKLEETIPSVLQAAKPTQQEFATAYQALCKKMGWMITAQTGLRQMNDLGGSIIVTQLAIIPFMEPPKQE